MKTKLSSQRIKRLAPTDKEYTVWDSQLSGFGLRVKPSGYKSFVLHKQVEKQSRRITLGKFPVIDEVQARKLCLEKIAQGDTPEGSGVSNSATPLFADFINGIWWEQKFSQFKPSGQRSTRCYINARLMPNFGKLYLDEIDRALVARWFEEYSNEFPGGANRVLEMLYSMMEFAIVCGHLIENPVQGIKKNPKKTLNRFLSSEEINTVSRILGQIELERPEDKQGADIIRMLLLTGCRHQEICSLKWSTVKGDVIKLADTKTGPRDVYLCKEAVKLLSKQPRGKSPFVFPFYRDTKRARPEVGLFWVLVRQRAGVPDVRVHDLRHTFASHAVLRGVPLPMVSKLLGHKKTSMTLRYTHVTDKQTEEAAERIGQTLQGLLGGLSPEIGVMLERVRKPGPPTVKKAVFSFRLNEDEEAIAKSKADAEGLSIPMWLAKRLETPPPILPTPSKWGLRAVKVNLSIPSEQHQQYVESAEAAGLSMACWARTVALEG